MIVRHQHNIAAFAGNHAYYWLPAQLIQPFISVTTVAAAAQIDGAATKVLSTQYQSVTVITEGTNWHIISEVG